MRECKQRGRREKGQALKLSAKKGLGAALLIREAA